MNIEQLPGGWFTEQDIDIYRSLVDRLPDGAKMIELGTWKGRSLCSVADLIIKKNIKVWAVDTFQGSADEGDAHKEAKLIDLEQEFRGNLKKYELENNVTVVKSLTDDAFSKFEDKSFDFIFIDADHAEEAVFKDINNYKPKIKEDGILAGHDWLWESVRKAVARAGLVPTTGTNMWYLFPKQQRSGKFSVCLIGRNEAKTLPRALVSLRDFKDRGGEICYLDTGSTDGTAQIAKDFGCVVEEVGTKFIMMITKEQADAINSQFIVEGETPIMKEGDKLFNFAEARNYCAEHLSSNDLVATMDCDEVYTKFDINKIEEFIAQGYDQFEYNFVFSHDQQGNEFLKFVQSKFYNRKRMKWVGIIHEVLQGTAIRKFLDESIVKLEHWQNMETNRDGYLRGLALDCWQHQEKDRNSHYFARELMWANRPKSAIKEFERYLTLSGWKPERSQSMLYIGNCYMSLRNEIKAVEWFHKAMIEDEWRREPIMKLAEYFYSKQNWIKVCTYCMAALEIPYTGAYASNKFYYESSPHELLAEAKWHMGDRKGSKEHFDKALAFNPYNSRLLHDYRFHYWLPKVSFLVPTLGRPEGLQRCLDSIKRLNYPPELIETLVVEDEPRMGVSLRVRELYKKSTGQYVVYASNDVEFTPDSLIIAFIAMEKEKRGLCAFNTDPNIRWYIDYDRGNICEHFMIKKELVEKIGGDIFDTDFYHTGVDNLLWYKCRRINEAMRCEKALVNHYHFSRGGQMDEVYKLGCQKKEEDKKLLAKKINEMELNDVLK